MVYRIITFNTHSFSWLLFLKQPKKFYNENVLVDYFFLIKLSYFYIFFAIYIVLVGCYFLEG